MAHGYTVISADRDFSNLLRFPLGTHQGIIVARFPRHTPARMSATMDDITREYGVTLADIRAVLRYAAEVIADEEIKVASRGSSF